MSSDISHTDNWSRLVMFEDVTDAIQPLQDVLGRKWYPPIVYHLLDDGPLGFSELKGRITGISSKMLSESLTDLEERGFISRDIVNEQPVRVRYSLTERGQSLEPVLTEMLRWEADGETSDRPETEQTQFARARGGD